MNGAAMIPAAEIWVRACPFTVAYFAASAFACGNRCIVAAGI
jgi:hypothetical protein